MKHIYIVRHCKAIGQDSEAALTEDGQLQALQLARFFSSKPIDCIISSPFLRAQQTIKPFADQRELSVRLDERLTERVLTDKDSAEWREMLRLTYDDLDLRYPGGESSREAMSRAVSTVTLVLNGSFNHTVLVSHGNLISLLLKHYDNRIGFAEWEALTNPDVFMLVFPSTDASPDIMHIWRS